MKIYFEDGELLKPDFIEAPIIHIIDAKYGFLKNQEALDWYNDHYSYGTGYIYTNSLVALSNEYCWNDELKVPELYIRPSAGREFVRVDKLTLRELRQAHNLMRMYMTNAFGNLD